MTGNEYQELAMRTNDHESSRRLLDIVEVAENPLDMVDTGENYTKIDVGELINGCLGLSGEVGEFNDMIKKWIFHEQRPLDIAHAKKEISDCAWYLSLICNSFGWNLDDVFQINIDKLKARYPEGFNVEASAHRAKGDV